MVVTHVAPFKLFGLSDKITARFGARTGPVLLASGSAVGSRAVAALAVLLALPIAYAHLGPERFAIWVTFHSLFALLSFADFGIGNGLMNAVSSAHGRGDAGELRKIAASGLAVLSAIAGVLMLVALAIAPLVPWHALVADTPESLRSEILSTAQVFFLLFAINVLVGFIQRIQLGMQDGYLTNLATLSGSFLGLIFFLLAVDAGATLPVLLAAQVSGNLIAMTVNAIWYFGRYRPELRFSLRDLDLVSARHILRLGGLFFVLQIATALAFTSDYLIISTQLGSDAVASYAAPARLFGFVSQIAGLIMLPFWPAYAAARAGGDSRWVRSTLRRSLLGVFIIASLASLAIYLAGPFVIKHWMGPSYRIADNLFIALAIWTVMDACGNAFAMFLNGYGVVKEQIFISSVFAVLCISGRLIAIHYLDVAGVVWATIGAYTAAVIIPYAILLRPLLRRHVPQPTQVMPHQVSPENLVP